MTRINSDAPRILIVDDETNIRMMIRLKKRNRYMSNSRGSLNA